MPNEPGDMITTLFSKLIDRIKSNRPMRSDDRPVTSGFVAFIVPVANLAALAGVIGFFALGLNRRHRIEQELLDAYLRVGRWPDEPVT